MEKALNLKELKNLLHNKNITESLELLASQFPGRVIFTSSFGIEDQILTHIICTNDIPIDIVTLDTGRLFPETYDLFSRTLFKYKKKINVFFPDYLGVQKMLTEKGPFSFYDSKENRIECCKYRKVEPLKRALLGKSVWISGIRAEQSDNRGTMSSLEWDDEKRLFKYHPLFLWSLDEVEYFINSNDVPYNILYKQGYPSIGCQPCTRPVKKGQDFRSGRWWWENDGQKECGCHVK
jgi:phosphoadenosine phosphosulfate reductase